MDKKSEIWRGEWWLPCEENQQPNKISGKLTCFTDDKPLLELIFSSSNNILHYMVFDRQPVVYGTSVNGEKYTIFHTFVRQISNSSIVLSAEYFITGAHIKSLDEKCFYKALVEYPNLKQWVFYNRVLKEETDDSLTLKIPYHQIPETLSVEVEDGITWHLRSQLWMSGGEDDLHIMQDTNLGIYSNQKVSLNQILQSMSEFSQFLSVALLSRQAPTHVFLWTDDSPETEIKLLFKQGKNASWQYIYKLIRYDLLWEKIPDILKKWHAEFGQIQPICSYLIKSLDSKSEFDAPDFLIVAQALDGYFKRFVNKKDGRDIQKYKQQIIELLKHFEQVDTIKKCDISPDVIADTRNKYSHLAPDDDQKTPAAVTDMKELQLLTTKAKILLICCILEHIGLSIEEINKCINESEINYWI